MSSEGWLQPSGNLDTSRPRSALPSGPRRFCGRRLRRIRRSAQGVASYRGLDGSRVSGAGSWVPPGAPAL